MALLDDGHHHQLRNVLNFVVDRFKARQRINRFAIVKVAITTKQHFGCTLPKRSIIPLIPQFGEHEDQVAPMLAVANIVKIIAGMFGIKPATRAPCTTPSWRKSAAHSETF